MTPEETARAKIDAVLTASGWLVQLASLNLIRDHLATSLSIEPDDFDYTPFSQRGGAGGASRHQRSESERFATIAEDLKP